MRNGMKSIVILLMVVAAAGACNRNKPPVLAPLPPPPGPPGSSPDTLAGKPQPVDAPLPVPPQPFDDGGVSAKTLDDLNRDSPLQPVLFVVDSADLDDAGRSVATKNADLLKR